jgi:hypothetical protein
MLPSRIGTLQPRRLWSETKEPAGSTRIATTASRSDASAFRRVAAGGLLATGSQESRRCRPALRC